MKCDSHHWRQYVTCFFFPFTLVASIESRHFISRTALYFSSQASKIQDASKYCVQQLVTMARHEEDFASEFLTTLSHCTTLMHKPQWEVSHRKFARTTNMWYDIRNRTKNTATVMCAATVSAAATEALYDMWSTTRPTQNYVSFRST